MLNSRDLMSIIQYTAGGTFFRVTFVKKNGEIRNLVGRLGVTKHLVGGQRTTDPSQFLIVWDTQAKGYRSVNKDSVVCVKIRGKEHSVGVPWTIAA